MQCLIQDRQLLTRNSLRKAWPARVFSCDKDCKTRSTSRQPPVTPLAANSWAASNKSSKQQEISSGFIASEETAIDLFVVSSIGFRMCQNRQKIRYIFVFNIFYDIVVSSNIFPKHVPTKIGCLKGQQPKYIAGSMGTAAFKPLLACTTAKPTLRSLRWRHSWAAERPSWAKIWRLSKPGSLSWNFSWIEKSYQQDVGSEIVEAKWLTFWKTSGKRRFEKDSKKTCVKTIFLKLGVWLTFG